MLLAATLAIAARAAEEKPLGPSDRATELVRKAGGTLSYSLPGYYGYPAFQTLEGQKQLGLTAEQKQKIQDIGFEYNFKLLEQQRQRTADWSMRDVKPEDRPKVEYELRQRDTKRTEDARQWADEARKQVEQLLDAKQLAVLRDLEFRQRIPVIYHARYLLDTLGLDDEQKKQIDAIYGDSAAKQQEASRKMSEISRQMYEAQNQACEKIVETLRPEQVEKLKELMARPVPAVIQAPPSKPGK
jgi:Spy/CpxP family protein refolding chaperone